MLNSKKLWNERTQLVEKMTACMNDGQTEDALRYEGEIRQLDVRIAQALDDEEAMRAATPANLVSTDTRSFAEKLLGARDAFNGITPGFKAAAPVKDAVSGLPTPQIYKTDLKAPVAPPTGFLGTILHGNTEGDEHFFLTPVLNNKAAGWTTGNKPESALEWKEGVANLETIAHHIPIKKQTANRYSQLQSIVETSLMLGLDLKADEYALRGSNSSGIVGVTNTPGILEHTKREGKNLKDTFAAMKRKVRVATGIAPNYVCLSPYALEELSEEKDSTGRYLFPDIANGGTIAGLTVVEDVNMTVEGENPAESALVYYAGGASWDIADPQEVTVGLINSQLIQNEYTVLAELTAALRVDMPGAFCYCGNLGIEVEA